MMNQFIKENIQINFLKTNKFKMFKIRKFQIYSKISELDEYNREKTVKLMVVSPKN